MFRPNHFLPKLKMLPAKSRAELIVLSLMPWSFIVPPDEPSRDVMQYRESANDLLRASATIKTNVKYMALKLYDDLQREVLADLDSKIADLMPSRRTIALHCRIAELVEFPKSRGLHSYITDGHGMVKRGGS